MSSLAIALGLPERYFDQLCSAKDHNLRLLHYPSAQKKLFEKEGQFRAGTHTVRIVFLRASFSLLTKQGKYRLLLPGLRKPNFPLPR
jgi:hypothetical protein